MARHTRIEVVLEMTRTGLVPLFYHADAEVVRRVARACYDGGARVFEFTGRGDFSHEVFADLSRFAAAELPSMMIGAGSLTDAGTAAIYLQMGAEFIVTPVLREDVARVCNRRKVLWAAGCGSLSEIAQAEEWGAEIVKVFPGETLGPGFVAAVRGPCPWTSIMPTGGVIPTEASLRAWFDAGSTCVGIGSKLIRSEWVDQGDFRKISEHVRSTLSLIETVRG